MKIKEVTYKTKNLIAKGELDNAIELLVNAFSNELTDISDELLLVSSQLSDYNRKKNLNIPTERTYEELAWSLIQLTRRIEKNSLKPNFEAKNDLSYENRISKKAIIEKIYLEKDYEKQENLTIKFLCVYEEGEKGSIEEDIITLSNDIPKNKHELGIKLLLLCNHAFKRNFHPEDKTIQLVYNLIFCNEENLSYIAIYTFYWFSNGYLKRKGMISLDEKQRKKLVEFLCFQEENINSKKRLIHIISKAHPNYESFEPCQEFLLGIKRSNKNINLKVKFERKINEDFNNIISIFAKRNNEVLKKVSVLGLGRGGYKLFDISKYFLELAQDRNNLVQEREEALLYLSQYRNFESWESLAYMATDKESVLKFLACCIGNNQVDLLKRLFINDELTSKYKIAIAAYLYNNYPKEFSELVSSDRTNMLNMTSQYLAIKVDDLFEVMGDVSERIYEELNAQYLLENEIVYGLRAKQKYGMAYYILKVEKDKHVTFDAKWKGKEKVELTDYGELLYKGYGDPPDKVKNEMRIKYGMYKE